MPKLKLSNAETYSIYISIALGIVGYIISLFTCDDVFPRFGSLIVCIGVFFSIKDLPKRLDVIQAVFQDEIQLMRATVDELTKNNPADINMKKQMESPIKKAENKMHQTLFEARNRMLKIEGSIIIAGTLIWGFGDYFVPKTYLSCLQ